MNAPLLVVGHAADHTGPPIYLHNLLRWQRAHGPEVEIQVALLAGGDLLAEIEALAPVTVFEPLPEEVPDDVRELILSGAIDQHVWWSERRTEALRRMMLPFADVRTVYVNGAPAIELARALPPGERTLLCHSHELEIGLTHRLTAADRSMFTQRATRIYSVAEAVTAHLVERQGADPAVIEQHGEMVDVAGIGRATEDLDVAEVRRSKGLDPDHLVVGACGTIEFRKGTDLFLEAAWHLRRSGTPAPATFVWVGGDVAGIARAAARAEALGLADAVRFVGPQADPALWFAAMDVFVMPSREDPFPLVCIEALAAGTPVVAFDTGGIRELLEQGCGEVVAYPDVGELAARVGGLLADGERRATLGALGRSLVRQQHDVSVIAPGVWSAIERWL